MKGSLRKDIAPHRYLPRELLFVIEIKCAEIVSSDQYPTGLTCRFPRCTRVRKDKDITDIATLVDIEYFRTHGMRSGAIEKRQRTPDKPTSKGQKLAKVDASFTTNLPEIPLKDGIFRGQIFCVKSFAGGVEWDTGIEEDRVEFSRDSIMAMIQSYGGDLVSNPMHDCWVISGSRTTVEVQSIISSAEYNVLHFGFIIDCIREQHWIQPKPRHFIARSKKYQMIFEGNSDKYGDSFSDDIDSRDLSFILKGMNTHSISLTDLFTSCDDESIIELIQYLNPVFGGNVVVFVDMFNTLGEMLPSEKSKAEARWRQDVDCKSTLAPVASLLRYYGARLSSELSNEVTYVMLDPCWPEKRKAIAGRIKELRMLDAESMEKRIVFPSWMNDCINAGHVIFFVNSSHDATKFLYS